MGPILIGLSVWATSWLVAASLGRLDMSSQVEALVLRIVPVSVSATAFFLVYRIIPNRPVPARHALAGGIVAALVFEAMKSAFAAYIRVVPTYQLVYGAFAAVPIFLVWVYLSWLVVLFGAEFTAALAWWRGRRWRGEESPGQETRGAFAIGRALAQAGGEPVPLAALLEGVDLPEDRLEEVLCLARGRGRGAPRARGLDACLRKAGSRPPDQEVAMWKRSKRPVRSMRVVARTRETKPSSSISNSRRSL